MSKGCYLIEQNSTSAAARVQTCHFVTGSVAFRTYEILQAGLQFWNLLLEFLEAYQICIRIPEFPIFQGVCKLLAINVKYSRVLKETYGASDQSLHLHYPDG
eukprot:1160190-Pelagomonas_calceolata.AAC.1